MMTPFLSSRWYYVDASNSLLGPISLATLDALFVEGVISLDTQVIPEKGEEFQPYSAVFADAARRMPSP